MAKPVAPPTEGRLSTKRRAFHEVITDIKRATYSVVRLRPHEDGENFTAFALGSGFFVSPDVFLTCHHVINVEAFPHLAGDSYLLVNEFQKHSLGTAVIGETIHLHPDFDLALLVLRWKKQQPYVALEYGELPQGADIGIAGYPLPDLIKDANGDLNFDGVINRVSKTVLCASYVTSIDTSGIPKIPKAKVLEVNFLFVPGNSGGPIFDAETGRVCAFVHGFKARAVNQRIQQIPAGVVLPEGMNANYVESLHAIYSIGIKLDQVRAQLEALGVTL